MAERRAALGAFWTVPNAISILRIPLAGYAIWLLATGSRTAAMVALAVAFLSDALDGTIARTTGQISEWGKILDPLSDKLVFAFVGVSLAVLDIIPVWVVVVLLGRDLLVGGGGIWLAVKRGIVPASNWGGKLSTVVLATWMMRMAFFPPDRGLVVGLDWLGAIAMLLLVGSTAGYAIRAGLEKPRVLTPTKHPTIATPAEELG